MLHARYHHWNEKNTLRSCAIFMQFRLLVKIFDAAPAAPGALAQGSLDKKSGRKIPSMFHLCLIKMAPSSPFFV
jgi:hypothetical protein